MADKINTSTATNTLKEISKEVVSLEASSIVSLYEIDLTTVADGLALLTNEISPSILRFHNIEVFNQRKIYFRGDTYHPMPIIADGFELNSSGALPRPTLMLPSIKANLSETEAVNYYTSLRRAILELNNMVGAKVSRIRTFFKFLDASNNFEGVGDFTSGLDLNPEFPRDIYYVERKVTEDKDGIQLELSSVLDLENFKLPGRICLSNRCPFQYRGEGCGYEYKAHGTGVTHLSSGHLPDQAPPVANDENVYISGLVTGADGASEYNHADIEHNHLVDYVTDNASANQSYDQGDAIWLEKDGVKYYYVAKVAVPAGNPPPNSDYWAIDRCSKTIDGCKMRWGNAGAAKKWTNPPTNTVKGAANALLPFGGFPGTNTKTSIQ